MTFSKILKATTFLLVGMMFFSSCSKEEDTVTIVEEEIEEIKTEIRMTINGNEIVTNAVAAYCMTEGQEFFAIATEEDILGFGTSTEDYEPNDFSFFKSVGETENWSYGGMAFAGSTLGLDDLSLAILFSDAEIEITSNDGNIVTGGASGTLFYFADPLDPLSGLLEYPYTMRFVANIIAESDYCG